MVFVVKNCQTHGFRRSSPRVSSRVTLTSGDEVLPVTLAVPSLGLRIDKTLLGLTDSLPPFRAEPCFHESTEMSPDNRRTF